MDAIHEHKAVIKVIGVGGGGGNAIAEMVNQVQDVEFYVANTDAMALANSPVPGKIQLGEELTKGLGAVQILKLVAKHQRKVDRKLKR